MLWLRSIVIFFLVTLMTACSSSSPESTPAEPLSVTSVSANTDSTNAGFVARVNGIGITQADYDRAFARRSINSNAASESALAQQVLNELIEQELINQGAPSLGITITDTDVEAEIATQREIAGSEDAWLASLAQNNYSLN